MVVLHPVIDPGWTLQAHSRIRILLLQLDSNTLQRTQVHRLQASSNPRCASPKFSTMGSPSRCKAMALRAAAITQARVFTGAGSLRKVSVHNPRSNCTATSTLQVFRARSADPITIFSDVHLVVWSIPQLKHLRQGTTTPIALVARSGALSEAGIHWKIDGGLTGSQQAPCPST